MVSDYVSLLRASGQEESNRDEPITSKTNLQGIGLAKRLVAP